MTLVANWPCGSPESLVHVVRDGWCGKTSPECLPLEVGETLADSCGPWGNSGMGSLTEFWTLDISESPNDAEECLLSDIIETGERPPQCCLTEHNIGRLKSRIEKHNRVDKSELYRDLCSVGQATKRRNMA